MPIKIFYLNPYTCMTDILCVLKYSFYKFFILLYFIEYTGWVLLYNIDKTGTKFYLALKIYIRYVIYIVIWMKYWNVDCKTNDLRFIQKKGPLCFLLKNTNVNKYCIQAQTNSVQILIHVDFDLMNTNLKFYRFNYKHSLNPKFSIYH